MSAMERSDNHYAIQSCTYIFIVFVKCLTYMSIKSDLININMIFIIIIVSNLYPAGFHLTATPYSFLNVKNKGFSWDWQVMNVY